MPALASSSRVQVRYIGETTFGVIPTVGNPRNLRITGESLDFAITKEQSAEINDSRTIASVVPVSAQASGGIQGELSYREYDDLLERTLQSAYVVYGTNGIGASFTATFTANTITATAAPTGASAFTGLRRGQWIQVNAPGNNNDDKIVRISTTVDPTSTVITLDPNTPLLTGPNIANVTLGASRLTHGTTQTSITIEKSLGDVGQTFAYTGQTPSKLSIAISSGARTTVSFDFMGKGASRASATQLPGTAQASTNFPIHSSVSGTTCQIWEGGVPLTSTFVKSLTLDYDNALRMQDAICTLGAVGIGSGTLVITVTAQLYFADGSIFDKFLSNTDTSLIFTSVDTQGNGYVFTLPVANISSYKVTAGAKDQDIMADVTFTALRDASNANPLLQRAIFIDRVGVAAV